MFTASIIGSAPLTTQWFKDGALLPGETTAQTRDLECPGSRDRKLPNARVQFFGYDHKPHCETDGIASKTFIFPATGRSGSRSWQQRDVCKFGRRFG